MGSLIFERDEIRLSSKLKYVKQIEFNIIEKYLVSNVIHSQDMKAKEAYPLLCIKISNKNLVFFKLQRGNIINFYWLSCLCIYVKFVSLLNSFSKGIICNKVKYNIWNCTSFLTHTKLTRIITQQIQHTIKE